MAALEPMTGISPSNAESARLQLLYQISRELNSPEPGAGLDLNTLLPRVLTITAHHLDSPRGSVLVLDERGRLANAWTLEDGRLVAPDQATMEVVLDRGLAGWVKQNRLGAVVDNIADDPRWLRMADLLPKSSGPGSALALPLLLPDRVVGVLTYVHPALGHFTQDDVALISAVADQITVAVENARLFAAERKQVEYLSFLHGASRDLTSSLDVHEILQHLLQRVVALLEVEAGSIGLIDWERGELVFEVAAGGGADAVEGVALKLGEGIAGWVAETGEAAVVPDVSQDSRWFGTLDEQSGFRTRSIIAVPIEVKGRRLGVIEAINLPGDHFDPQHMTLLRSLAGLAGSAIANAQAFSAVQAAEDRYAGLFEDSIDPILMTDIAGTITEANRKACDFLDYAREDLIGVNISLVHRMGTGLLGEQRLAVVQSGAELIFKTRAWLKSGREVPVEVHAKRIRRRGQDFLQWIEHDITEREELEEMREDLLAMIFHDLRAPLGNVLSSLEMLEAALPRDEGNAVLGPLVDIAVRSSQRLSHLLNSLLDLRRLETGQAILTKEPVELAGLVHEAMDQVQPSADMRAVRVSAQVPPRVPLLLLDVDMIRRVLINVLDNAIKYTRSGGRVQLSVEVPPREAVLVIVKDEGLGIAPEHQRMIFEKFSRVQRPGGPKGLGLGLAFCRLAIEAHGGRIWVESTPGHGATFKFTLPV